MMVTTEFTPKSHAKVALQNLTLVLMPVRAQRTRLALITVPHRASERMTSGNYTESSSNPAQAWCNSEQALYSNTRILPPATLRVAMRAGHHSARQDSRTATQLSSPKSCPTKPKLYITNRSDRPRKRGALHKTDVGEVGRTTTRTACPTKLYGPWLTAVRRSEVGRTKHITT
jgi:hypothetical protein